MALVLEAVIALGILFTIFYGESVMAFLEDFTRPAVREVDMSGLYSPCSVLISSPGGKVIGEVNAKERIYPASMTKMMTAILAIEKLKSGSEITFTSEISAALEGSDATRAGFETGETVPLIDVLYGIILPSGADCCLAVAYEISGSEEEFADLMNKKAARIGMKDTHFCNSTGLHDDEHYSTVYDMAILLKYCLRNSTFREIITSRYHSTGPTNIHPDGITYYSTLFNNLSDPAVTGGEILGGKTGYTSAAGHCLASFAEIDGREYILVTAGADGTSGEPLHIYDAKTIYNRTGEEAQKLTG